MIIVYSVSTFLFNSVNNLGPNICDLGNVTRLLNKKRKCPLWLKRTIKISDVKNPQMSYYLLNK